MDVVSRRHRFSMTPNRNDSRDVFLAGNWQAMVISTYDNVLISLKLIDLYDPIEPNDASKPLTLVPFALRIYYIPYSIFQIHIYVLIRPMSKLIYYY